MERFPTVQDLAKGDIEDVLTLWAGLGYYSRAHNLHKAAQTLVNDYGGYFPQELKNIRSLPGIGEYTAGAIASISFGQRVPAVAATEEGKVRFFGNGCQNKFIKRRFRSKRKQLGKAKKPHVIRKINNKEQRWMRDKDHKISCQIIDFAKTNHVSVIRLEQLSGIRQTARTSRKNEKNLHTWSFYRLAGYIEYKALLEGIAVEYVDPRYTSQTCPVCNVRNHARDRYYECSCGFTSHRDILGAKNIINAPVADGSSLPA